MPKSTTMSTQMSRIALSALLLVFAYPSAQCSGFAWVALVPLLMALYCTPRIRTAWWYGYAHGVLVFGGMLYWITHVTILGYILLVALLACYTGVFAAGVAWLARRPCSVSMVSVASWWVLLEWARNYFLTGFSWGLLGYTQAFHPLVIQCASVVGVYGLSWLVVLGNTLVLHLWTAHNWRARWRVVSLLLIGIVVIGGWGVRRLRQPLLGHILRVGVVQGNIAQQEKWDAEYQERILAQYERLSHDVAVQWPDVIVWPETAVPGILPVEYAMMARVQQMARTLETPLLVGTPWTTTDPLDPTMWNTALLLHRSGQPITHYNKLHLVPFGEFVPLQDTLPWLRNMIVTGDFDPGAMPMILPIPASHIPGGHVRAAALICFEDLFPELSRRMTHEGARLLINMTNDAWFGRSSAPYQHLQASILRAVEQGVPVVRSTNTGVSAFIDGRGRVLRYVQDAAGERIFVEGVAVQPMIIPAADEQTPYQRAGDWWVLVCALLILGDIFRTRKVGTC
jgi:apolipoprotein N-acyltransferase